MVAACSWATAHFILDDHETHPAHRVFPDKRLGPGALASLFKLFRAAKTADFKVGMIIPGKFQGLPNNLRDWGSRSFVISGPVTQRGRYVRHDHCGDALHSLRNNLIDPYKVLQSWDPTLVNPCMWFHITCDDHDSVIRVDLGNASLSGQLVPQLGELKKLQYLKLQSNNLSGPIPSNLGNLQNLVSLDLYFNHLSGSIPDTLGELSKLRFLRLNNNHLTGNIPISLTDVTKLQVLDLSNNLLSGHVPDNGSFSSLSFFSCANNLNLCGHATGKPCPLSSEFPPPFVAPPSVSSPGNRPSGTGVISGLVCGSVILFATVFGFAWWHWQKPEEYFFDVQNFPDEEYKELPPIKPKIFSLHVLQRATDGFNKNNIVGRGGFGTIYKGRLPDGSLVAVKRLKQEFTPGGVIQFMTEVDIRNRVRHPNVLPLVGFCVTPVERLLVFPYMTNKSVGDLLRGCKPTDTLLDWPTRKKIALGSAKGLFYLHDRCNPKIIHRDVKASNVMLDDKFEAILGDFGLAKSVDCDLPHVTTVVRGTIGHICPEYLSTGKVSNKTDVFGYGMMLLELITGQGAFDLRRLANDDDVMLLDWVKGHLEEKKWWKLVDPDLKANYIDSEVEQMIHLALQCTRLAPMERPDMSDVVTVLEDDGFEESWEEWLEARMIGGSDLEGEEESGSQRKGKGKEHEELQEGTSYSQEVEYAPDWNMDFNANLCSNEITECGHF